MDEKTVYIHYGHDKLGILNPITNSHYHSKPHGGLWASRINDPCGWKSWCEGEEFRLDTFDKSFKFTLKDSARVLLLNDIDQLDNLPKMDDPSAPQYEKGKSFSTCYLDFEKLQHDYDAIELTNISQFYWALYGWDCNSIIVMNQDVIEEILD